MLLCLVLAACGGGGGGGTTDDPDPGPGPGPDPDPDPSGLALALNLQQGDWFEYVWTTEAENFAQPDSYDSEVASGRFRITLGPSTNVSGSTAFPLKISGDPDIFRPRWTHVAEGPDGSLLGSIYSGLTLVYSTASTNWQGGGFFADFGTTEQVYAANGQFVGNYNQMPALVVSYSVSEGGCEAILGHVICDDEETTFSEREYYKRGVGPIGYAMRSSYTSSGGGFYSTHQRRRTVELIATSETPTDGSVFRPPPWEEMADLPQPRYDHAAAVMGGEIYVFGGYTTGGGNPLQTVLIYNPGTDSWRTSPHNTPGYLYSPRAVTIGSDIWVISQQSGTDLAYRFRPATGWSPRAALIFDDPSFDACTYDHPTLGDLVMVVAPEFGSGLELYAYRPSDDTWYTGDTTLYPSDQRWSAIDMIGDTLYVSGGYRQYMSQKVSSRALRQDMDTETNLSATSAMTEGRYDHESAVLDGMLYALGGRPGPSGPKFRSVEVYHPGSDTWTDEVPMFGARCNFAAVVLNGSIYVMGGDDGNDALRSVEKFTPQD